MKLWIRGLAKMKLAMIGLGKMGINLVANLRRNGHEVVAFDLNEAAVQEATRLGALPAKDIDDVVAQLPQDRKSVV